VSVTDEPALRQPALGQPALGQPALGQPALGQPAGPRPAATVADVSASGTMASVSRRATSALVTTAANRRWWDREADAYQSEHGEFLGAMRFVWCPEGLDEANARLLGDVAGRRVLEVGCGAAQCARWLRRQGADVVGVDISWRQLQHARRLDEVSGTSVPVVLGDAQRLPFRDEVFDVACSAYGALPFVADSAAVLREVARVVRPGGRWVFSTSHPIRWCFPDDPGDAGLVARDSYFDRTPYVELDDTGAAVYVEHHRTLGDWVRVIGVAGLRLIDLVEPEWPDGHERPWGGWSRLRGRILPGTAIFVCEKPGR
jgi:SAM-dependent methyltransferase